VNLSDLVAAYEGSGGRTWVLTSPELEALMERVVQKTVRRVLDERDDTNAIDDAAESSCETER
jgi:hypothetical protein